MKVAGALLLVFLMMWTMARCTLIEQPVTETPSETAASSGDGSTNGTGTGEKPSFISFKIRDRAHRPDFLLKPIYRLDKDLKKGMETVQQAEKTRHFLEAEDLLQAGNMDDAVEMYDRALAYNPLNGYIKRRRNLAVLGIMKGEFSDNGYIKRANSHMNNKRHEAAEETARLAIEEHTDNPFIQQAAHEILASCYWDKNRQRALEEMLITEQIQIDINYQVNSACLYYEGKDQ